MVFGLEQCLWTLELVEDLEQHISNWYLKIGICNIEAFDIDVSGGENMHEKHILSNGGEEIRSMNGGEISL